MATALAHAYALRVVDNHVSIDPALTLFNFGTPQFRDLVERLRVTMLQAAADANISVVSTLVYACGVDDHHLTRLVTASTDAAAEVSLVHVELKARTH